MGTSKMMATSLLLALMATSNAFIPTTYSRLMPKGADRKKARSVLSMAEEQTFIMVKPDGVSRGLSGRIISRFEDKGLKMVRAKFTETNPDILNEHYAHIADKPFYPEVFNYMTSAPVLQMVFEGTNAVAAGRAILGATNPMEAPLGTVRGDFGLSVDANLCHGSDSVEAAATEMDLWFSGGAAAASGEGSSSASGERDPLKEMMASLEYLKGPNLERTFIIVKPDGVSRKLSGRIISRFEDKGLTLVAAKHTDVSSEILDTHYAHIADKPFYPDVKSYMTSGPVLMLVFQGTNAVAAGRAILGATNPMEAPLGTVRGDFGLSVDANLCHGSDSVEASATEIDLWFSDKSQLVSWTPPNAI